MTLVVEGAAGGAIAAPAGAMERLLQELLESGVAPSQAAKVAVRVLDVPRNEAYNAAVRLGAVVASTIENPVPE